MLDHLLNLLNVSHFDHGLVRVVDVVRWVSAGFPDNATDFMVSVHRIAVLVLVQELFQLFLDLVANVLVFEPLLLLVRHRGRRFLASQLLFFLARFGQGLEAIGGIADSVDDEGLHLVLALLVSLRLNRLHFVLGDIVATRVVAITSDPRT